MPGLLPKAKVTIQWSPNFAYAIGLITTDGNLSSDRRHINFTSKDLELVRIYRYCLGIDNKIGKKARSNEEIKKYFCVQFGDVLFYQFLRTIGLTPRKSKTLGAIAIPDEYFFDFLRGHFDGDGTFYSYLDPRWKSSYMFYTVFISASKEHIHWLQATIFRFLGIQGHITKPRLQVCYQLRYAKHDSLKLLPAMYRSRDVPCLQRKKLKIQKVLSIIKPVS